MGKNACFLLAAADFLRKTERSFFSRERQPMKALSVANPWAWGIINGPKRIENRSWRTSYRGLLLIHASKAKRSLAGWPLDVLPPAHEFVYGALIGTVNLIDCVPLTEVADDPFACGEWCWKLDDPQAFEKPIPFRGSLSLFHVPDDVLSCD